MIETARKEDLFLDKKLIIPENRLDAIRIMARLHPVVGDQPTNEKDQPNTNNPILDLACTILNIHEKGIGVHADLRAIQNEPPKYFYGKGFMSGISNLKGNGILAVYGQWRDASGRYAIKQFYYTDKEILWRNAISDTAWSAWFDVLTGNSDLDYNKLLNVPITSTLSDDKTKIASIFAVNNVNRAAVTAQKTANTANANAVDAMNEALKKMDLYSFGLGSIGNAPNLSIEYDISERLPNGFYKVAGGSTGFPSWKASGDSLISSGWGASHWSYLHLSTDNRLAMISSRNGVISEWSEFHSTGNTRIDLKGVIHSGTKTPTDVLLVGDYGFADYRVLSFDELNLFSKGLTFNGDPSSGNSPFNRAGSILQMGGYAAAHFQLHFGIDHTVKFRKGSSTDKVWGDIYEFYTTANTTTDPAGFLRAFGNAVALTTDKLTSDLKVNRSDLVASAKYAYDVYQAALAADKKAANAQNTANTGVANAKTAQIRADAAFSKVKPIAEGGTGATTAAQGRKNMGHGDASTRNVATSLESNGNTLVPAALSLGFGQKYKDVTAERAFGIPYKNESNKPKLITISGNGGDVRSGVFVNSTLISRIGNGTSSVSFICNPADEYQIDRYLQHFLCVEYG